MKKTTRRQFAKEAVLLSSGCLLAAPVVQSFASEGTILKFRLLRHATLVIETAGKQVLVDPMLSRKGAMDPVKNAADNSRIPMTELPVDDAELKRLLVGVEAVLVTHTHRDHWDDAARQLIAKDKLIFCQPSDEQVIREQGFTNVVAIEQMYRWGDIAFHRTGGQHGTGETAKAMGQVSGFVITCQGKRLYIAGDTIWCREAEDAITTHQPQYIIVNGGGAQFLQGGPITMTTDHLLQLCAFTSATISVVHLETINHCLQRRADFKKAAEENGFAGRVHIPLDGAWTSVF